MGGGGTATVCVNNRRINEQSTMQQHPGINHSIASVLTQSHHRPETKSFFETHFVVIRPKSEQPPVRISGEEKSPPDLMTKLLILNRGDSRCEMHRQFTSADKKPCGLFSHRRSPEALNLSSILQRPSCRFYCGQFFITDRRRRGVVITR